MRVEGFHHLAIQVHDLEEMGAFYRRVLGLTELTRHLRADGTLRSIWLSVGGPDGFLALEEVSGVSAAEPFRQNRPGLLLVALRIAPSERSRVLEELSKHGVEVVHQTAFSVYFRDPEGNRVALSHHPEPVPKG
ncbi:MAG: VOC family protein [Myxococcaceae bacterium]